PGRRPQGQGHGHRDDRDWSRLSVLYLVERYLPSWGPARVAAAVRRVSDLTGPELRHMWTVLVPSEETCLSLFDASSDSVVAEANDRAEFGFTRIVHVLTIDEGRDVG